MNYTPTKEDNLDKTNKFLEACNLSKLNQKESENLSRTITTSEIEAVKKKKQKNLPANKSPGLDGFTGKLY